MHNNTKHWWSCWGSDIRETVLEKWKVDGWIGTYLGNCILAVLMCFHLPQFSFFIHQISSFFGHGMPFSLASVYFRHDPSSFESFFVFWYVKLIQIHLIFFSALNLQLFLFPAILVPMRRKEIFRDHNLSTVCHHINTVGLVFEVKSALSNLAIWLLYNSYVFYVLLLVK